MDLCSYWLFVVFTFRCCQSWRNVVDDRIEGRSLGEAEVWGSWSCGAFVRRNNGSGGYDDPGGHRFVVHGLYRRCTVLKMTLDMLVKVRGSEDVTRCKACTCVCAHGSGSRSIGRVERVRPSPARAARVAGVRIDGRRRARRGVQPGSRACLQLRT